MMISAHFSLEELTASEVAARAGIDNKYEIDYWSKKFGVTPDQLRNAVKRVGPSAAAVERELQRPT